MGGMTLTVTIGDGVELPLVGFGTWQVTGRHGYAEAALVPLTGLAALPAYGLALRRTVRWKGRTY